MQSGTSIQTGIRRIWTSPDPGLTYSVEEHRPKKSRRQEEDQPEGRAAGETIPNEETESKKASRPEGWVMLNVIPRPESATARMKSSASPVATMPSQTSSSKSPKRTPETRVVPRFTHPPLPLPIPQKKTQVGTGSKDLPPLPTPPTRPISRSEQVQKSGDGMLEPNNVGVKAMPEPQLRTLLSQKVDSGPPTREGSPSLVSLH